MDDDLRVILIFIIGVIVLLFLVVWGFLALNYTLNNYPISIIQGNKIIFEGSRSCIEVESGGDTTKVIINQGYLCLFPKEIYVGKEIEIIPKQSSRDKK